MKDKNVLIYLMLLLVCSTAAALSEDVIKDKVAPLASTAWSTIATLVGAHKGDSMAAIVTLKSYFAQFGYMNSSNNTFNMEFDDALDSALRLYQQNFNLEVTGSVNLATIAAMLKPRCGREDVIDGVSQMISRNGSSSSSRIHAVEHYAFFPGSPIPKWRSKKSLTYAFEGDVSAGAAAGGGGGAVDQVKNAMRNGFTRWAQVVPLTFREVEDPKVADIVLGFASFDHGDDHAFDGPLGVLAHAFQPEDGRLHLDGSEHWALDFKSDRSRSAIHLDSVATHEIGHLLGLGHSGVPNAIMFPSISAREIKTSLSQDDVEGAQLLYGANPNYVPGSPGINGGLDLSSASSMQPMSLLAATTAIAILSLFCIVL